jgi:hypothetical protein
MKNKSDNYITLEKAKVLFENFKSKYSNTDKNISMLDCLVRNDEIKRLPLYVLIDDNYIETRENIKNISRKIYVNSDHLDRFFHKELIRFTYDYDYDYDKEENNLPNNYVQTKEAKEIVELLRPGLDAVIAKMEAYPAQWTEIYKRWIDDDYNYETTVKLLRPEPKRIDKMKKSIKQELIFHRESLQNIFYNNDNLQLDKGIIIDMFDNLDNIISNNKWDKIKEVENIDDLMIGVEKTFLAPSPKKVLLLLLSVNKPLSLLQMSEATSFSIQHVWAVLKRLSKHHLIKKYKRNVTVYTFNAEECKKFLANP